MGRSRLDRSIQYKYLNPNLVAVVTESTDPLRRESCDWCMSGTGAEVAFVFAAAVSVYLLDAVTGGVVFHTTHKAAVAPLHLVHSENWVVVRQIPLLTTLAPSP